MASYPASQTETSSLSKNWYLEEAWPPVDYVPHSTPVYIRLLCLLRGFHSISPRRSHDGGHLLLSLHSAVGHFNHSFIFGRYKHCLDLFTFTLFGGEGGRLRFRGLKGTRFSRVGR
jgi:hypothetical protein